MYSGSPPRISPFVYEGEKEEELGVMLLIIQAFVVLLLGLTHAAFIPRPVTLAALGSDVALNGIRVHGNNAKYVYTLTYRYACP